MTVAIAAAPPNSMAAALIPTVDQATHIQRGNLERYR
jgi:hypothetical protein